MQANKVSNAENMASLQASGVAVVPGSLDRAGEHSSKMVISLLREESKRANEAIMATLCESKEDHRLEDMPSSVNTDKALSFSEHCEEVIDLPLLSTCKLPPAPCLLDASRNFLALSGAADRETTNSRQFSEKEPTKVSGELSPISGQVEEQASVRPSPGPVEEQTTTSAIAEKIWARAVAFICWYCCRDVGWHAWHGRNCGGSSNR